MVEDLDFERAGKLLVELLGLRVILLYDFLVICERGVARDMLVVLESSVVKEVLVLLSADILDGHGDIVANVVLVVPIIDIFVGSSTIRRRKIVRSNYSRSIDRLG